MESLLAHSLNHFLALPHIALIGACGQTQTLYTAREDLMSSAKHDEVLEPCLFRHKSSHCLLPASWCARTRVPA